MPFGFPSVLQSKSIALNTGATITDAKLLINTTAFSDVNDFEFYMSADGGTNWEQVTLNETHSFTNTGNELLYQIIGNSGSVLKVRQTNGIDYVIKVVYNESS